ncbi:MAG: hypothetical protein FJ291_32170 [Planctomycetes bacterium]|nr:hypothetical protein [Planctomycetota bacterium]
MASYLGTCNPTYRGRVHADQNQCFLDWHGPDGLGRVDPASGRPVVLTRLNTRPPLEMKSGG